MKKIIVKLEVHDEKAKQKAIEKVSSITGVDSISMEMKEKKLTVIGDIDPVFVVSKLRKLCSTDIISIGPAKEEKKPETKTEEAPTKERPMFDYVSFNSYPAPQYYLVRVAEDPIRCCIL